MRPLLNTLYVTLPESYLALNGENIVIKVDQKIKARFPIHNIESIVTFSDLGISPKLLEKCLQDGVTVIFLTRNGRFRGRILGETNGNVLLRKKQYRIADSDEQALVIARNFILAKVYNSKWQLERYIRDYPLRIDTERVREVSRDLNGYLIKIRSANDIPALRGFEGSAQALYFSVFNEMILNQKETFFFSERSRRPPLDPLNCLLSLFYTLLANDVAAALESVGLDSYVGYLHSDRPGRTSLALDLMEEFRAVIVDRFVLSAINRQVIGPGDFITEGNGAVILKDDSRKELFKLWQEKKQLELRHPFIEEKIQWGLVPHVQAMLLARHLRGDLDAYPPFFWK